MDQRSTTAAPTGSSPAPYRAPHGAPTAQQGDAPRAVRRPPRADGELRERPARLVLPGWTGLTALAAALAAGTLVTWRPRALPARFPDARVPAVRFHSVHLHAFSLLDARLLLGGCALVAFLALVGLVANPVGTARVLSRWGSYRGTVRRTGLVWISPLLRRHPVDVRVRHWRSEPIAATDREGSPIRAEVLLVWSVRDTARACFAVQDHHAYLAAATEAALRRVTATLPCDSFASPGPCLRDGQWLDGELTRLLAAETAPIGLAVYSAQAVALDYTGEFAGALRRRRLAELDAGTREVIVGDALETAALAVARLEHSQGLSFDGPARAGLVRDLVTAFLTLPAVSTPAEVAPPQAPAPQAAPTRATPSQATPATLPQRTPGRSTALRATPSQAGASAAPVPTIPAAKVASQADTATATIATAIGPVTATASLNGAHET